MNAIWKLAVILGVVCGVFTSISKADETGKLIRVRGFVTFEARKTIVPYEYCQAGVGANCPKPQTYWVVVLNEDLRKPDAMKYETNESFAMGSETAPNEVRLSGIAVHPGQTVVGDAVVQFAEGNYTLISDLQNVSEVNLPGTFTPPILTTAYGWRCRETDRATDRTGAASALAAEVFYQGNSRYQIHISTIERNPADVSSIVTVQGAIASQKDGTLIYSGVAEDGSVQLEIGPHHDPVRGSASILTIAQGGSGEKAHQMSCKQTR